eukprot:12729280-Prorocentrum_lima.AAC.1
MFATLAPHAAPKQLIVAPDPSPTAVARPTWLYGYDTQFAMTSTCPNGLACCKVLGSGEITWKVAKLSRVLAAKQVMQPGEA